MKGMPLPFDFEDKGVLELVAADSSLLSSNQYLQKWNSQGGGKEGFLFVGGSIEPTSVLDNISSPSPPTSTSTLSSSLGGGGGSRVGGGGSASTDTASVAAVSGNPSPKWPPLAQHETGSSNVAGELVFGISELQQIPPSLEIGGTGHCSTAAGAEKCGLGMEDWESVLSDSVTASPGQEHTILRWIMGDVEDPSMGLNKVLQIGGGSADFDFNGGFGVVDQGFGLESVGQVASSAGNLMPTMNSSLLGSGFPHKLAPNPPSNHSNFKLSNPQNPMLSPLSNNFGNGPISLNQLQQSLFDSSEMKPQVFNPQVLINQHQAQQMQNPALFLPVSYTQQEHNLYMPPQAKRHNPGNLEPPNSSSIPKGSFLDSGQELLVGRQQQQMPFEGLLQHPQQRSSMVARPKMVGDELGHQQQQQQAIIDQLYKAAELVQSGNPVLAQGILARLNHQLSPIGKPFQKAAYYCKEALQLLLHTNNLNPSTTVINSPFSLIFKIGAYKSFSEISPFLQFANFTCNQAILEALDGFDRIHIFDFDIGYGGQWASLMQELALKSGGAPSLKITAFACPSSHDQLELGLARENLNQFASEINMAFELETVSVDALNSTSWSLPLHISENEAIAVNLPVGSFFNHQVSLPLVLRFIKQLSPKIVVSMDRGCDRTDLPFPNHIIHALHSYSNLLESLDAVNVNHDALQKIERFLLQPGIEKIVMGRYRSPEKTQHWRTLFLSSGFSPLTFSNFTESQAECVVKRTPVRGFHVEKRQSSLVLCWQRRELISASAWRC